MEEARGHQSRCILRAGIPPLRRPLGNIERTVWSIDGVRRYNWMVTVRVRGTVASDALRGALDRVQRRHPLLGVHIELPDGRDPWFVAEGTPRIPLRTLRRSDDEHWPQVGEEELNQGFAWREGPLIRAVHLESRDVSDILLVFHHVIADGLSGLNVARDLLRFLTEAQPSAGPSERLPERPNLEDQLPPISLSGWWRSLCRLAAQAGPALFSPPLKLPPAHAALPEDHRNRLVHRRLRPDLTQQLLRRAREEQCSAHGALCAALMASVASEMKRAGLEPPYSMFCASPVDLRGQLVPPVGPDEVGVFVGAVFSRHRVGDGAGFWELARAARRAIARERQAGDVIGTVALRSALALRSLGAEHAARALAHPMWGAAGVTNVGSLDVPDGLGGLRIEELHYTGPAVPYGTLIYVAVSTLREAMTLNFSYTEPLVLARTAETIADGALARLRAAATGPAPP